MPIGGAPGNGRGCRSSSPRECAFRTRTAPAGGHSTLSVQSTVRELLSLVTPDRVDRCDVYFTSPRRSASAAPRGEFEKRSSPGGFLCIHGIAGTLTPTRLSKRAAPCGAESEQTAVAIRHGQPRAARGSYTGTTDTPLIDNCRRRTSVQLTPSAEDRCRGLSACSRVDLEG